GIAFTHGLDVTADGLADSRFCRESLFNDFTNQQCRQGCTVELVCQMKAQGRFQAIVVEDGRMQEACEHRFALYAGSGFLADGLPDRVACSSHGGLPVCVGQKLYTTDGRVSNVQSYGCGVWPSLPRCAGSMGGPAIRCVMIFVRTGLTDSTCGIGTAIPSTLCAPSAISWGITTPL